MPYTIVFSHVVAMIAPQHDDRVVGIGAVLQSLDHTPDLVVGKTDAGQIGVNDVAPLLVFDGPIGAWHLGQDADLLGTYAKDMQSKMGQNDNLQNSIQVIVRKSLHESKKYSFYF